MERRPNAGLIAALLLVYLVLAAVLPAIDDEMYYWCWSKSLQFSYYDHPAMTAALIRISTSLLGDSRFGMRVPACIASAFVVYVIARLTPSRWLVWAVIFSPLFTIGAVMITPDSPLVMFWAAYLWWLVELHQQLDRALAIAPSQPTTAAAKHESQASQLDTSQSVSERPGPPGLLMWSLGGLILGLGVLSKYTMGLAVPCAFFSLLYFWRSWRSWLPWYVYHGVISFVVSSPILIYNLEHHFEPILFQLSHAAQKSSNPLSSFGQFAGAQILLFGTLPIVLFPWVISQFFTLIRTPRLRVCFWLYAFPLAFFLYKSTGARLEANWGLISFISFWPLAWEWYQRNPAGFWRRTTPGAFLPPVLAVVFVIIHLLVPIPLVPVKGDRVYRQIAMNRVAHEIAEAIRKRGEPLPVYVGSYQQVSLLRFEALDARQIADYSRPSHFTRPPQYLTDVDRAYVLANEQLPDKFCEGFSKPDLLAEFPVIYRAQTDAVLKLWRYSKPNAATPDTASANSDH